MKRHADKNRKKAVEYKVEDRLLLSIRDLVWQIRNSKIKKIVRPYKIKKNYIREYSKVEVTSINKNSSSSQCEQDSIVSRVGRATKILPFPVEVDREKKYKVKKILNRRDMRDKPKYLVRQKGYMIKENTQKRLEN